MRECVPPLTQVDAGACPPSLPLARKKPTSYPEGPYHHCYPPSLLQDPEPLFGVVTEAGGDERGRYRHLLV